MSIITIGINHKTAPIEIRETFYLNSIQQDLLLSELKCSPSVLEAFVLSTCNRTEIYLHTLDNRVKTEALLHLITRIKKLSYNPTDTQFFYNLIDQECIKHLLRVVTGIDSLIIGEKQILGQVKSAFERSRTSGFFSKHFNILSNIVIRAGKKAQNETNIGIGGSSVSWAAIATAEKVLGTLQDKSLLMIGAGKMSELAVGQISSKGFKNLYLMNRTQANAELLAQKYGGEAIPFCDIKEVFKKVDVCICAADAPHYILDRETIEKIFPDNQIQKIVLIDISMPRNIDPRVSTLKNVTLFHIDDLNKPIEETMKARSHAISDVEKIIADKVSEFYDKIEKTNEATRAEEQPLL